MATETAGTATTRPADVGLKREVGFLGAVWASESSIIGSGWLFAALGATQFAGASAIYGWLIGGVAILILALIHAELGGMYPVSGGTARFPHYAFGGVAGITFGFFSWLQAVAVAPFECYGVMRYAHYWWTSGYNTSTGLITGWGLAVTIVLMAVFTLINWLGIKILARVNSAVMWWKLAIPVLAIIVLLFKWHSGNFTAGAPGATGLAAPHASNGSGGFAPFGPKGVLNAVVTSGIVFSYLGFEQADQLAGEVRNPQKVLPRAIITAMAIGTAVYILVQIVFIAAMDPAQLTHGFPGISNANVLSGPIAGLAGLIGLSWLATILRIDAFISPSGTGLIYLTSTSRVTYGLARNRYIPQAFQWTDKRGVPWFSLLASAVFGVIFLTPNATWQAIVSLITGASVLMYAGAPLSLAVFRNRLPEANRPYRLPGALIIAPLGFIVANLLIYWSGFETIWKLGICFVIGYAAIAIAMVFDAQRPKLGRREWIAASWVPVYLIGLGLISWNGQFAGGATVAPLPTGRIHLWYDIGVVAVFSLVIYFWAYFVALPRDEILGIIGEQVTGDAEASGA